MTPQEALNKLDETFIGELELKVFLSNVLEKQIPKKVKTEKYRGKTLVYCPTCDALVCEIQNIGQGFCSDCGQRLDWEDLL